MKINTLIRTIYLYFFALVGLFLIIIPTIHFINLGLKVYIFTQADEEQKLYDYEPPYAPEPVRKLTPLEDADKQVAGLKLTEAEQLQVQAWLVDYEDWKERRSKIDRVTAQRHREAASNLAMLIVGIPVYLFHWQLIKRHRKEKEADKA